MDLLLCRPLVGRMNLHAVLVLVGFPFLKLIEMFNLKLKSHNFPHLPELAF